MDADTHRVVGTQRLPGLERDLRREGSALLLAAERLSADDQRITRRDSASLHLHGVPEQLPVAAGSNRRRFLREKVRFNEISNVIVSFGSAIRRSPDSDRSQ